ARGEGSEIQWRAAHDRHDYLAPNGILAAQVDTFVRGQLSVRQQRAIGIQGVVILYIRIANLADRRNPEAQHVAASAGRVALKVAVQAVGQSSAIQFIIESGK